MVIDLNLSAPSSCPFDLSVSIGLGFPRTLVVGPSHIHQWTGLNPIALGVGHMGRSRSPGPKPLQVYIYECIEISTVFKKRDHDSTFYQGSEIFTILAGMAEKICIGHQTGTENVLKCTGLNTGCFNWYRMFSFVQAISDGFCASSRYKKCSSNPVVSAFNFFVTALFFFSPFPRRQQLFVTVSSSFLSFSCSFYLFLSLFYPYSFISLPSCTPCFKK